MSAAKNGRAMKAKGSAFEREVVRVLHDHGLALAARSYGAGRPCGVGDISGVPGFALEVKACRRLDLAGWADEAAREAANVGPGTVPVAVVKRRGHPPEDAYAVLRLVDFAEMVAARRPEVGR